MEIGDNTMAGLINDIQFEIKVSASRIRTFYSICVFLSKVGKELIFEIDRGAVTFRALSDAKSSLAAIRFGEINDVGVAMNQPFFEYIQSSSPAFSCKVPVKPICSILRNLKNLASIVIRGQIVESEHELVFEFAMTNLILKSYRFSYSDCQILNAVFDDTMPTLSVIQTLPKVLLGVIEHIHNSHEMTISAGPNAVQIRSFHGGQGDLTSAISSNSNVIGDMFTKRNMSTGINMNTSEFDLYEYNGPQISSDGLSRSGSRGLSGTMSTNDLTFCIKEFKAMLSFCESEKLESLAFYFSTAGNPIKIVSGNPLFSVELIMSTLFPHTISTEETIMEDPVCNNHNDDDNEEIAITVAFPKASKHPSQISKKQEEDNDNSDHYFQQITSAGPLLGLQNKMDFSHITENLIASPPLQPNQRLPTSSAKKRRIIEDDDEYV